MIAIRKPMAGGAVADPVELLTRDLLGCHAKIRRFSEVARRLATAEATPVAEIAAAARALVDYFQRALPLHVADEDESLRPRLLLLRPTDRVVDLAVERMHDEHRPLEALVAAGVLRWQRLASAPELLPELRGDLVELARSLELGFSAHLAAEEAHIFPALERLVDDDVVAIRREMRLRRAAPSGAREHAQ